ncbi:MAG: Glutamyl-tRNA(Gln) amidotransferase subunit A, partial [Candidatus Woesebacteria bacterium GW2011_GWE1_45_18]
MNLPLTIKETQEGLKGRKFKVAELVREYLERIKKYDREINSFLTVAEESAFEKASRADEALETLGEAAL